MSAAILLHNSASASSQNDSVVVNSVGPMGSIDPIHQDALNSTIIFKNVYPRLINLGSDGDSKAYLSDFWNVSSDRSHWTFHIRPRLLFENGRPITPEVIARNFKRILWLTKNEKTQLHLKIIGLSQWKALEDRLPGVRWDAENVYFDFSRPHEEFLETLDQAIFGIVPPETFDSETGNFLKSSGVISGGYYVIEHSDASQVILRKNPRWQIKGPGKVIVRWDPFDLNKLTLAEKKYDLVITNGMNFNENMRNRFARNAGDLTFTLAPPVLMNFVQLNALKPVFADINLRKAIQSKFYAEFFSNPEAAKLFSLSNSFMPKGAPGFKEHAIPESDEMKESKGKKKIVRLVWWPPAQLKEANDIILNTVSNVIQKMGFDLQVYNCQTRAEMIDKMRAGDFDIIVRLTGVLIRNPLSDLKLMFQSKMGALIPDLSGNCSKLLDAADVEENPEARRLMAEKINDQIFRDASILTYSHSGFAFVYNSKRLSISRFNLHNDPFDFTAIELIKAAQ